MVKHGAPGGDRTRDPHVISVPHPPTVLPAPVGIDSSNPSIPCPWRESNSHPQRRRLALFPLSYRGFHNAAAPLAGVEPAASGFGNRCAVRCATRAWGDRRELNPSTVESHATVLPLHHDRHEVGLRCASRGDAVPVIGSAGCPLAEAEGLEPPAACDTAAR